MDANRFRPQVEEIEARVTPNVAPADLFNAAGLAAFYYNGTAALVSPGFIGIQANRAPTQAVAATIIAQTPTIENTLGQYVAQLQTEQAAANPAYAGYYNQLINRFVTLENLARVAGIQAQEVSTRIDTLNAASSTSSSSTSSTSTTGTTSLNGLSNLSGATGAGTSTTGSTTGTTSGGTTTGGTTSGTTTGSPTSGSGGTTGTGSSGTGTGTTGTSTGSTPGTTTGSSTGTTPIGST